ncbi:helix-turn-helix domain-containing protein [Pseudomonas cannabina]|uniref:helix-turn-helix domain-containing protein n=1 Tax=Pseudomonas cannabina TaxID=86840 RepID=UPI001EE4404F|nr:helix-turn-helix domain-containing protein [Pseudomonas cannabina]
MSRKKSYKVDFGGRVLALPYRLLIHPAFDNLSPKAVVVLIKLARNDNGRNNGDLSCTADMLAKGRSMDAKTLASALQELIEAKLIIRTRPYRKGGREEGMAQCALYAIAWAKIDECPGKGLETAPCPAPFKFI